MLRLEILDLNDRITYQDQVITAIPALQQALGHGPVRDWWRRLLGDLATRLRSIDAVSLRSADAEIRGTLRELFAPEIAAALDGITQERARRRREQMLLKAVRTSCSQLSAAPVQVYDGLRITRLVLERPGQSYGRSVAGEYAVRVAFWWARDAPGYFRWRIRSLLGSVYDQVGVFNLLPPQRFGVLVERMRVWATRWDSLASSSIIESMDCDRLVALQLLYMRVLLDAILKAGSPHANIPLLLTLFAFQLRDATDPRGLLWYDEFIRRLEAPANVARRPFYDFCRSLASASHLTLADRLLTINCYQYLSADLRADFMTIAHADERKDEPFQTLSRPGDVTALLAASVADIEAFLDDVDDRFTANTGVTIRDDDVFVPLIFDE